MRIDVVYCTCGCQMEWAGTAVTCPECGLSDDLSTFTVEDEEAALKPAPASPANPKGDTDR